jgi:Acetyltransferases
MSVIKKPFFIDEIDQECIGLTQIKSKEKIFSLLKEFDKDFYPPISSQVKDLNRYAAKLKKNALVYAAQSDRTLGFIAFYANDKITRTAYIAFLGVHPFAQNNHIGKMLINLCFAVAEHKGMAFVKIEVKQQNKNAIRFYIKNGYEHNMRASNDSIYMIKTLEVEQ